ncbi:MAG TPA: hypothetical protein PLM25_10245 [Limnochordia bacterium]|nr:hypothetical protein [Limnochordia bacterium]
MHKHEEGRRRADLEEQLAFPWDWAKDSYRHVDGWELNQNRMHTDKFLLELGKEHGPTTVPHRRR